jgi:hypothetical protein
MPLRSERERVAIPRQEAHWVLRAQCDLEYIISVGLTNYPAEVAMQRRLDAAQQKFESFSLPKEGKRHGNREACIS